MLDYFDVAPGYGFARVGVAKPLAGKQLGALDVSGPYGVAIVALRRGNSVTLNPDPSEVLRATDELTRP